MTGKIRIIGGQWRGRKLTVQERPGLRPTGDRARETLFNWLQPVLIGATCLDLFAGTGSLGLEAASRGAARVVMIEQDRQLAESLRQVATGWPGGQVIEVFQADAMAWLEGSNDAFDVVFVDPPFLAGLQADVLDRLATGRLLNDKAIIYVEQAVDDPIEIRSGDGPFTITREKLVGRVRMTLLGYERPPPV